jgi:hypothetical protein
VQDILLALDETIRPASGARSPADAVRYAGTKIELILKQNESYL